VSNKIHKIQPRIGSIRVYRLSRRDELIIHRLRIGHTRFSHSRLVKGESPAVCIGCDSPLTVQYIFVDCVEFARCRSKCFNVSGLEELFDTVQTCDLIDFIKEIDVYCKLWLADHCYWSLLVFILLSPLYL
jgi:hypothetical protein